MVRRFRPEDNGKRVVTPDGSEIGSIVKVRDEDAYVAPRSDLLDGCGSWLGEPWKKCDEFPLDRDTVAVIRDDRIVLEDATVRSISGPAMKPK